jgi:23S rRNA (pseudouridine1915-N3)-methyltransferase
MVIEEHVRRLSGRGVKLLCHEDKSSDDFEDRLLKLNGNLILLDESGISMDSIEFSKLIAEVSLASSDLEFAVASADGFSEAMRQNSTSLLSLSKMTMPHELAAAVLMEQLYRASEINRGSPYHRRERE